MSTNIKSGGSAWLSALAGKPINITKSASNAVNSAGSSIYNTLGIDKAKSMINTGIESYDIGKENDLKNEWRKNSEKTGSIDCRGD